MKLKVRKVGNSLTVTIPKEVAELLDITSGDIVEVKEENGMITITRKTESFDELLKKTRAEAKRRGLTEEDVLEAIYEIRYGDKSGT